MDEKILQIVKLCQEINLGTIEYNQQVIDLYILREYVAQAKQLYVEIIYMDGMNQWRYKIIDLEKQMTREWSKESYEYKNEALIDGVIKLFEIIKDEKRYTIQFDDTSVQGDTEEPTDTSEGTN